MSATAARYRLPHLFYATAVLGASLALYGEVGIFMAIVVLLAWHKVFVELEKSAKGIPMQLTALDLLCVLAFFGISLSVHLPPVSSHSIYPRRRDHLEQISRALRLYHDQHGSLPPAYLADERGHPAHSWRVLILPQLGHQAIYNRYRFDEAWDSPHNARLQPLMPEQFKMRMDDATGFTDVLAVVGDDTAWPGAASRRLDEIADDPQTTLLVVATSQRSTPWTAPSDLSLNDVGRLLIQPPATTDSGWREGFVSSTHLGVRAIPADGFTTFIGQESSAEAVRRRFRIDDETEHTRTGKRPDPRLWKRYRYGRLVGLAAFVTVVLWPVGWIWRRQRVKRDSLRIEAAPHTLKERAFPS